MTNVMTPETSEKGLRICLDSYVDSDYVEVVPVCLEYLNSHKCFFFLGKNNNYQVPNSNLLFLLQCRK